MSRTPNDSYFLTPQAEGWLVWRGTECSHTAATLEDAAAFVPAKSTFELALPCYPLIMERLRLPAVERDELEGMVQLQWEKSLPFTPEEIVGGFIILEKDEGSAAVWSVAIPQQALEEFSLPWRKSNRWPKRAVPFICYVAACCPAAETVLVLYSEAKHWVMAVVEDCRPAWVHVLRATDSAQFAVDFPSLLLTAGMEGGRNEFSRVLLAPETAGCGEALRMLAVPIEPLPLVTPSADAPIDLLPPHWNTESRQHRGRRLWRSRLGLVGSAHLILLIAALVHLALLRRRNQNLETELRAGRPELALMQARQGRSDALSLAIDPRHYTLELLFLLQRCLPTESVQFTEFEQVAQQWRVVGEAPSAALAIDYLSRLKHDPDLSGNQIAADPPRLLPNGRAQFQVIGKP